MKTNKMKKKALSGMAAITKKTSGLFANVSCTWWEYTPKMPKSVKKMRKF